MNFARRCGNILNSGAWLSLVERHVRDVEVAGSNPVAPIFGPNFRTENVQERRSFFMGKLYFTRHGQTVWNVQNKICGSTDIALTDKGIEQAKELGEQIKFRIQSGNMRLDGIYYSPLARAADTANYIAAATGLSAWEEPRLTEQNFGKYESTPRDGEEFQTAKMHFIDRYDGGETMLHLAQRIYNLLDDLKARSGERTYLLVAHNGIARVVHSYFYDMNNEEYAAFGIRNCEVREYDF